MFRGVTEVRPGGRGPTLSPQFPTKSLPPSLAMTKIMEDFEDILSYLRDHIANCKDKKDSFLISLCC